MGKKKVSVGEEPKYSVWVGLWKSFKNVGIVILPAAGLHLLGTYKTWVPPEYMFYADFGVGLISYLAKNWVQFNKIGKE